MSSKIALGITIFLGISVWFFYQKESSDTAIPYTPGPIPDRQEQIESHSRSQLFGESILEGYGSGTPENDLRKLNTLLQNYRLLAKGMDARHFAANETFSSVLRGENLIALQALPKDHPIFSSEGLIIDRWGHPIHFHLESAQNVGIYSTGPDAILGTQDDYSLVEGIAKQGTAEF